MNMPCAMGIGPIEQIVSVNHVTNEHQEYIINERREKQNVC